MALDSVQSSAQGLGDNVIFFKEQFCNDDVTVEGIENETVVSYHCRTTCFTHMLRIVWLSKDRE